MYNNIGRKIKILAKVIACILAAASAIIGVEMIVGGLQYGKNLQMIGTGMLYIGAGSVAAWLSSFVLYGFGELIERVCRIDDHIRYTRLPDDLTENGEYGFDMRGGSFAERDFSRDISEDDR